MNNLSQLEAALEREKRRLDPSILNPTVVYNLNDIKRVIEEYNPNRQKQVPTREVHATVRDEEGVLHKLSSTTKSKTKREYLIEGLDVVKKHIKNEEDQSNEGIEINGVKVKPLKIGTCGEGSYWVDPIIRQWLGAYRSGLFICWDIQGKRYKYDIYEHRLFSEDIA